MANQRRSVWEIRFRALKEAISRRIECVDYEAARRFFSEEHTEKDRRLALKQAKAELMALRKQASEIEENHASRIWIGTDW